MDKKKKYYGKKNQKEYKKTDNQKLGLLKVANG